MYLCGSCPSEDTWEGGSTGSGCAACVTSRSSCLGCNDRRACCRCSAWRTPCILRRRWCRSAGLWHGHHRWGRSASQPGHLKKEREICIYLINCLLKNLILLCSRNIQRTKAMENTVLPFQYFISECSSITVTHGVHGWDRSLYMFYFHYIRLL